MCCNITSGACGPAYNAGVGAVDLLGFSLGGFVAQDIALLPPAIARRLILAGTGPKGAPRMHGPRDVPTTIQTRDAQHDARPDDPTPGATLAGLIPDARIRIHLDASHASLFQYPAQVAADVEAFLAEG